jgi:hypothetical protein
MAKTSIAKYLYPWKLKLEREAERLDALRARDGDDCARCRRPLRFDLPAGHDQSATVEALRPGSKALDNFRLCHPRCNVSGLDHTEEVAARVRLKAEAALFARGRKKKAA